MSGYYMTHYGAAAAVTTSDSVANVYNALYVGTGGALKVTAANGVAVTFANVPNGSLIPLAVTLVWANGTTASNIVGLS